jgi:hypothetical protein
MKLRFFVIVFCILVVVGTASAQTRKWVEVTTPGMPSVMGAWYIDYSSIRRLPDGNVTYWGKGAGVIFHTEVNCVAKEQRTLKRIELASTDRYGNRVNDDIDITDRYGTDWKPASPTSISDNMNGIACRSAKNVAPQSDKPVVKKKAVNRTRKKQ